MTIYFDMDGTIADFYGVQGWLDDLRAESIRPYREAKPLINMSRLARKLNLSQSRGHKLGIISWQSRAASASYAEAITQAKLSWLQQHLRSVHFDEIHIVAYGTPKQTYGRGILFDDELPNRVNWGKGAYEPGAIFEVLDNLL